MHTAAALTSMRLILPRSAHLSPSSPLHHLLSKLAFTLQLRMRTYPSQLLSPTPLHHLEPTHPLLYVAPTLYLDTHATTLSPLPAL